MSLTGFENYAVEMTPRLLGKVDNFIWWLETYANIKPIHEKKLAKELGVSEPDIRRIAAHCILNKIAAVGSNQRGVYLCKTREEAERASEHRIQRGRATMAVGYALKNYFPPEEQGDLQL